MSFSGPRRVQGASDRFLRRRGRWQGRTRRWKRNLKRLSAMCADSELWELTRGVSTIGATDAEVGMSSSLSAVLACDPAFAAELSPLVRLAAFDDVVFPPIVWFSRVLLRGLPRLSLPVRDIAREALLEVVASGTGSFWMSWSTLRVCSVLERLIHWESCGASIVVSALFLFIFGKEYHSPRLSCPPDMAAWSDIASRFAVVRRFILERLWEVSQCEQWQKQLVDPG
jgi:hypothetical protein